MTVGMTRGKRRLGRYLRPHLELSGLKIEQVATEAECARQTVSRLLSGDALPRKHLFMAVLTALRVTGEDRTRALELWRLADAATVTVEHASTLPSSYRRFRMDEGEALRERTMDTVVISGLLQTARYAEALSLANRSRWKGAWDSATGVAERRDRQALLTRPDRPLALHALLDEAVLRRAVGGPDVLHEQLDHLVEIGSRPNITIQVIPASAGAYGAMSGPLFLLSYPEEDEQDSAYVESLIGMSAVEKDEDVATLSAVWDGAASAALPADESARLIRAAKVGT